MCPFNYKEIFDLQPNDCKYYVDDIWISGFLRLNNTDIYLVPNSINNDEIRHKNNFIDSLCNSSREASNIKCVEYFRDVFNIWK